MIKEQKFEMERCNKVVSHLEKELTLLNQELNELNVLDGYISGFSFEGFVNSINFEINYTKQKRYNELFDIPNFCEDSHHKIVFKKLENFLHHVNSESETNKYGNVFGLLSDETLDCLSNDFKDKKDFYDALSKHLEQNFDSLIKSLESNSIIETRVAWLAIRGFLRQIEFDINLMMNNAERNFSEEDFKSYFYELNIVMDKIKKKESLYEYPEIFPDYKYSLLLK